jgi:hypothetical protein
VGRERFALGQDRLGGNVRLELDATRTVLVGKKGEERPGDDLDGHPSGRVTVRRWLPSAASFSA